MRESATNKRSFNLFFFLILIILASLLGCQKQEERRYPDIELPVTPVLTLQTNWAVITSSHLRLREKADVSSPALNTLWKGSVIEILSQTSNQETVEDITDYWYQISYDGLKGWVFGGYLKIFRSKDEAVRVSREYR